MFPASGGPFVITITIIEFKCGKLNFLDLSGPHPPEDSGCDVILLTPCPALALVPVLSAQIVFHATPHHMDRARKTVSQMRMMARGLMRHHQTTHLQLDA